MNKTFILILTIIFLFDFSAHSQSILKADKKFELGQVSDALKIYLDFYAKNKSETKVLSKIARCYSELNMNQESLKYYSKLMQSDFIPNQDLLDYGHVLKSAGEYANAVVVYTKLSERKPSLGEHHMASAKYALKNKKNRMSDAFVTSMSSELSDFSPSVYNGNIVFASFRNDFERPNSTRKKSQNQLFVFDGQKLRCLKNELNAYYNQAPLSFSEDSKWVAYAVNNFKPGLKQNGAIVNEQAIFIAEVNSYGEWINTKPFPYNVPDYACSYPVFSNNGNTLYYASNQPDGLGGFDIYMSKKENGEWQLPVNMGSTINSYGNEIGPYVYNNDLYFSSDWHFGFGGFDIFKASKSGDQIKIMNLGSQINSAKDDYDVCFLPNGDGFFTTNRIGNLGQEDIYQFNIKSSNQLISEPVVVIPEPVIIVSEPVVEVAQTVNEKIVDNVVKEVAVYQSNEVNEAVEAGPLGFSIQLASYNYTHQVVDRSIFKSVADKGNLYDRISGDKIKVKLGIFKTREEADRLLFEVRELGFNEAFITTEEVTGLMDKVLTSMNDKYVLKSEPQYGVRLAAYSKPESFESYKKKLNQIGQPTLIKNGKWHVAYMIDVESTEKARAILSKVTGLGFKGAYLVKKDEMGHYSKL